MTEAEELERAKDWLDELVSMKMSLEALNAVGHDIGIYELGDSDHNIHVNKDSFQMIVRAINPVVIKEKYDNDDAVGFKYSFDYKGYKVFYMNLIWG